MPRQVSIGLVLVLSAFASAARADDWSKKYALTGKPAAAGKPQLRVETDDGNVTLRVGEAKEISAEVHTVGWKISPEEVRITERQTGDRVELEVKLPRHHWGSGRRSLRVEVTVPRETDSEIQTGDGNISIEEVRGATRLLTGDGNVEARSLEGTFEATTGDGNVRVNGRFDRLSLKTGDGDVTAEVASGSKMAGEWSVRTGDGNVTLRLPEGFAAELDAHTGDGKIDIGFPLTVTGTLRESAVRGNINGGGPLLSVRTGDGSIRVERL